MAKYYICGGSDTHWIPTNATTINGAKSVASKTYHPAVGGKLEVGEKFGQGDTERIEQVAVKHGYDNWQQAY
jgi:hypothetical protein